MKASVHDLCMRKMVAADFLAKYAMPLQLHSARLQSFDSFTMQIPVGNNTSLDVALIHGYAGASPCMSNRKRVVL